MYLYEETDFDRWLGNRGVFYACLSNLLAIIVMHFQFAGIPVSEIDMPIELMRTGFFSLLLWSQYLIIFFTVFFGLDYLIFKAHERYKENKERTHND